MELEHVVTIDKAIRGVTGAAEGNVIELLEHLQRERFDAVGPATDVFVKFDSYTVERPKLRAILELAQKSVKDDDGFLQPPDKSLECIYDRVDRLTHKGVAVGTCFRIDDGLILTARHCVIHDGELRTGLRAFGETLLFIAAFPKVDVALLRGPAGDHFELLGAKLPSHGQRVQLWAYPLGVDDALGEPKMPTALQGIVSAISPPGSRAVADYTGLPNASGGAVLISSRLVTGLHIRSCYHRHETLQIPRRSTRNRLPEIEYKENELTRDAPEQDQYTTTELAADLAELNIEHKPAFGPFVPSIILLQCLDLAEQEQLIVPHVQERECQGGRGMRAKQEPS